MRHLEHLLSTNAILGGIMKEYDLAAVLSVTTGVLFTEMEVLYDIFFTLTGAHVMTHQLPAAKEICTPVILKHYPELAKCDVSDVDDTNWFVVLHAYQVGFGNSFIIGSINEDVWQDQPSQ
jgi:hypothetical protein